MPANSCAFICLQAVVLETVGILTSAGGETVVDIEEESSSLFVDESVPADDESPVGTNKGVEFLEPLFITLALPEVSSGEGNSCGCLLSGLRKLYPQSFGRREGEGRAGLGADGVNPCISI